jgi:AAHS family benzoate transporter-like MFS transporter
LGGIFGPLIGGALISAGISSQVAFSVFAGIAVLGAFVTFFVPRARVALRAEVVPVTA